MGEYLEVRLGKRKPGHGPDNAVATNRQSTEGTNR